MSQTPSSPMGRPGKVNNWDLLDAQAAEKIESLNRISQKCVAEALAIFLLVKTKSPGNESCMPDESALIALHRAGTIFLLNHPGCYRDTDMTVTSDKDGEVVHRAPPPQQVGPLMADFFQELAILWTKGDALDIAAYAAWRLGWIHPFRDGNGRTARLFSYVCLCVRLGGLLPSTNVLVDQIFTDQTRWVRLLLDANQSYERGKLDLTPVKLYLDRLLLRQIRSAKPKKTT